MADALLRHFRQSLPDEILHLTQEYLTQLEQGHYLEILQSEDAQALLGHSSHPKTANISPDDFPSWNDFIFHNLGALTSDRTKPEKQPIFFCIGYAALLVFLQSTVTGPPIRFSSSQTILPSHVAADKLQVSALRQQLISSLSVDGIAAYKLTPNVEMLCLADAIMTAPAIVKNINGARWAKMRISFMQQRLLSEVSSTLQNLIYDDLDLLADNILTSPNNPGVDVDTQTDLLLERATIHIHHGLDKFAKEDLEQVKKLRHFQFALTGHLGKRTKFQQSDISQLVVLAKSADKTNHTHTSQPESFQPSRPTALDLNDDTLLESISFSNNKDDSTYVHDNASLPPGLSSIDPSDQPQLSPLDSTTLLQLASSIKNTSPENGLTREETLPYATRVLDGGSSNWQIYTQALLVRSRIEGYRARTIERGLLQLQALVDQIIADTATDEEAVSNAIPSENASFLPRPKDSESATAPERLRYIFQLASPTRWELEAELAARWVQLGGLRSALDIYERLEMWAEAALCWAATEREDKARRVIRRQLFHQTRTTASAFLDSEAPEEENWEGAERLPRPLEAPRLYCILGDIDSEPAMWEKAWTVSNKRYARAQRSLGRYYLAARDFLQAAKAYSLSLKANQLNHSSWFAMGCALLELDEFERAAEAFSRCVQLDDQDAESWSNLAAALLRNKPEHDQQHAPAVLLLDDEEEDTAANSSKGNPQQHKIDALKALKRAAALKHDSYRIWENVLIVAASISPPDWNAAMSAQRRIIELRGSKEGEKCLDTEILTMMARNVIANSDRFDPDQPGFARMFVKFIDQSVVPLITGSADLWQLVAKLALWRNKPSSALDAEEKAWRAITAQPTWETDNEKRWNEVVEATIRLCDAYESLGPKERTEGMGAGEPVMKDWQFKAKSAIRTVQGRGKSTWEDTEGWERLKEAADQLH